MKNDYMDKLPVSYKKLEKLTVVTEKNFGKVYGDIKRFFSYPVLRFAGMLNKPIYKIPVIYDGEFCGMRTVYSENKVPTYNVYIGNTEIGTKFISKEKIIRIFSSFDTSSTAIIEIGSKYKIIGNRLIILDKYNPSFHRHDFVSSKRARYHEFLKSNDITLKDIYNYKVDSFQNLFYYDEYYFYESVEYERISNTLRVEMKSTFKAIIDFLNKKIDDYFEWDAIDRYRDRPTDLYKLIIDFPDFSKTVDVLINCNKWMTEGLEGQKVITFYLNGQTFEKISDLVYELYKERIENEYSDALENIEK